MDEISYQFKHPFQIKAPSPNAPDDPAIRMVLTPPKANQYNETSAIRAEFFAAVSRSAEHSARIKNLTSVSDLAEMERRSRERGDDDDDGLTPEGVQQTLDLGGANYAKMIGHLMVLLQGSEIFTGTDQRFKFVDPMTQNMSAADMEGLLAAFVANFMTASWMQRAG